MLYEVITSSLTVLTNDGTGGFGFSASIPVGTPNDVTTADVNGDGWLDLISAGNDTALTVLSYNFV